MKNLPKNTKNRRFLTKVQRARARSRRMQIERLEARCTLSATVLCVAASPSFDLAVSTGETPPNLLQKQFQPTHQDFLMADELPGIDPIRGLTPSTVQTDPIPMAQFREAPMQNVIADVHPNAEIPRVGLPPLSANFSRMTVGAEGNPPPRRDPIGAAEPQSDFHVAGVREAGPNDRLLQMKPEMFGRLPIGFPPPAPWLGDHGAFMPPPAQWDGRARNHGGRFLRFDWLDVDNGDHGKNDSRTRRAVDEREYTAGLRGAKRGDGRHAARGGEP